MGTAIKIDTPEYGVSIETVRLTINVGDAFKGSRAEARSAAYIEKINKYFAGQNDYVLYGVGNDTIWLPNELWLEVSAIDSFGTLHSLRRLSDFINVMIQEIGAA